MQAAQRGNRELWLAGLTIIIVAIFYLIVVAALSQIPPASEVFGHALGIIGFFLMLLTETVYSLRKRSRRANWGRMSDWLSFHIYTGIVGPYLVLLHSSWKFHGLAGVITLMTMLVAASGFVGRYIYTSIPRTADEVEIESDQVLRQIKAIEGEIHQRLQAESEKVRTSVRNLVAEETINGGVFYLFLIRPWLDWQQRRQWHAFMKRLSPSRRNHFAELERLTRRRDALKRQIASLALARRLFALWHAVHIPLGVVLFVAAFIHIAAAIYYAEML